VPALAQHELELGLRVLGGSLVFAIGCAGLAYGRFLPRARRERHVADMLGITPDLARALLERAWKNAGSRRLGVRQLAFVVATTSPGRQLVPRALRQLAIRGLVAPMIERPPEKLAYLGLVPELALGRPHGGLRSE